MPNTKTDSKGFTTENVDIERDENSKGNPATGVGTPRSKRVVSPYNEDLQTQIAAKGSARKKREEDERDEEFSDPTV